MFINASFDKEVRISRKIIDKLPRSLMLFTTSQFINQLESIKKQLKENGKEVILLARGERTAKEMRQFAGSAFRDFEYLKYRLKME